MGIATGRDRMEEMARFGGALKGPQTHLRYHPGHTWTRLQSAELVAVGATDFAVGFLGRPATVQFPRESRSLGQSEVAWTLVSASGRRLRQFTAVTGKVVAVNTDLLRDPALLQRSPQDRAWILCIKPRDTRASMRDLLSYEAYLTWIDRSWSIVSARLDRVGGLVMENGVWPTAFGDHLSVTDWKVLRSMLFPNEVQMGQRQTPPLRVGGPSD